MMRDKNSSLLGLPNIGQRVCCQLWLLVTERNPVNEGKGGLRNSNDRMSNSHESNEDLVEIANPPTHLEIAIMLNVSRETVTRIFQTLQNRQIVKRAGAAKLVVSDPAALRIFAEGREKL